jgi:hypothetical protein
MKVFIGVLMVLVITMVLLVRSSIMPASTASSTTATSTTTSFVELLLMSPCSSLHLIVVLLSLITAPLMVLEVVWPRHLFLKNY